MTKLQKALKEKAVMERALRMACFSMRNCDTCLFSCEGPMEEGACEDKLMAHFKAEAEKEVR